jgi:hypothetical protein
VPRAALRRLGCVFERNGGPSRLANAITVHPHTLEVLTLLRTTDGQRMRRMPTGSGGRPVGGRTKDVIWSVRTVRTAGWCRTRGAVSVLPMPDGVHRVFGVKAAHARLTGQQVHARDHD